MAKPIYHLVLGKGFQIREDSDFEKVAKRLEVLARKIRNWDKPDAGGMPAFYGNRIDWWSPVPGARFDCLSLMEGEEWVEESEADYVLSYQFLDEDCKCMEHTNGWEYVKKLHASGQSR
jgi:hypothetical protein